MTLQQLFDGGELMGYEMGYPGEAAEIDGPICNEAACDSCGHVGLVYHPYKTKTSYRAFAVCPECGEAMEF